MTGRRLFALFLVVILSLYSGMAHAFSLLAAPQAGGPHEEVRVSSTILALDERAAEPLSSSHSRGQAYEVEPIFSLEFPKTLVRDVVYAVTSPARWDGKDWLIFGAGLAGVAAVSLADTHVRNQVQHIQNSTATDAAKQIRQFGGPYSYGVLGFFLVGGEAFDNASSKAVFIDGSAATLVSGASRWASSMPSAAAVPRRVGETATFSRSPTALPPFPRGKPPRPLPLPRSSLRTMTTVDKRRILRRRLSRRNGSHLPGCALDLGRPRRGAHRDGSGNRDNSFQ